MPRYFFDVTNGGTTRDDQGTECADFDEVRSVVMRFLPDMARDEVPRDGDQQTFTVVASDETGRAVYAATLTFTGLDLTRKP